MSCGLLRHRAAPPIRCHRPNHWRYRLKAADLYEHQLPAVISPRIRKAPAVVSADATCQLRHTTRPPLASVLFFSRAVLIQLRIVDQPMAAWPDRDSVRGDRAPNGLLTDREVQSDLSECQPALVALLRKSALRRGLSGVVAPIAGRGAQRRCGSGSRTARRVLTGSGPAHKDSPARRPGGAQKSLSLPN